MKFKFEQIVDSYYEHVSKHIPNYDRIINKSIDICKTYKSNDNILDFGSANGQTLQKLYDLGFTNLHGVESERTMRAVSPKLVAGYYEQMPNLQFSVILANWVLHFIEDKISLLEQFYRQLEPNGSLIISEKVSTDPVIKSFYYERKREQGTSEQEIIEKENSLNGVMHVKTLRWYIDQLNIIGFTQIEIIDGDWGFVSLLVKK
jgi:SAM-dependent methyltransferase